MNVIIDYGLGNLDSIKTAFDRLGVEVVISKDAEKIKKAKVLILPGVGAFRDAIYNLEQSNLIPYIEKHVNDGKYLLGICLGMQLLYENSYENGEYKGLGFIKGCVKRLNIAYKVPHMGWNKLRIEKEDKILKYTKAEDFVYFVHSYYVESTMEEVIAYSDYGVKIPAIVKCKNIYGMQFHPEKSSKTGEYLLKAFCELIR